MAFHHSVTVRFNEIDRAGIVFFGRFFEYCHAAFEELITAMFGPLEASFQSGLWAMPLVHAEADYVRPTRLGERLDIALEIRRLGTTSVTCSYRVTGPDGSERARITLVHACVDPKLQGKCPIPPEFRAGLERFGLGVSDGNS